MPERKNPLGPTGERVAETIAAAREAARLSYRGLSDALGERGRGIPTLGLSRIERRERRVDADDLVALALALETTPNRLLLTGTARTDTQVHLSSNLAMSERDAWSWAQGQVRPGSRRYGGFRASNVPVDPRWDFSTVAAHFAEVHAITNLVTDLAKDAGISTTDLLGLVQSVLQADGGGDDGS